MRVPGAELSRFSYRGRRATLPAAPSGCWARPGWPGAASAPPSPSGPAAAGGTRTPTTTSPSTPRTSARPTSCGARRGCGRRTRDCSATWPGPTCSRSVPGRRPVRAGCAPGRAPGRRWTCPAGCCAHAAALGAATGIPVPLVQAGAERLPFRRGSFDLACSAFGAVPFVADPGRVMAEVARVLRPGGRWVFAVNHPMRWVFSDDPGPDGLTVRQSYFDRTPYLEVDDAGAATYVEHHRTVGDRIRDIVAAGLVLDRPGRTGVAGGPGAGLGPVVPAARRPVPRHGDLRLPSPRTVTSPGGRSEQGVQPAQGLRRGGGQPDPVAVPHLRLARVDPDQRAGGRRGQLGLPAHGRHRAYPRPARAPPTRRGDWRIQSACRPVGARSGPGWNDTSPNIRMFGRAEAPHDGQVGSGGVARMVALSTSTGRRRPASCRLPTAAQALQVVDRAVALGHVVRGEPGALELPVDVRGEHPRGPALRPLSRTPKPGVRHGVPVTAPAGARRSPRPAPGRRRSAPGRRAPRSAARPAVRRVGPPEALRPAEVGQPRVDTHAGACAHQQRAGAADQRGRPGQLRIGRLTR